MCVIVIAGCENPDVYLCLLESNTVFNDASLWE